jgi:two-component system sensor histidine kinase/response regulator
MKSRHQETILVVEDDDAVLLTLTDILELHGCRVVAAANGLEGFEAARRELPSLIITDVQMPGMTGFELLKALRRDEALRAIPVIVVSAAVERASTRLGMELGAADFITKPFSENEVIRSIAARLEKKELLDELDAFAHTVAHDLRNPLATLMGRLGLLDMTWEASDPKAIRHGLKEASTAARRLNTIIDELLVLAGVRRQHVDAEPLDMAAIVAEARARLEDVLHRSEATVAAAADWPVAVGHAPWVTHVWTNYISNAAKYAGPAAHIQLGSEVMPEGRTVRFWVADRGPGLSPEAQSQLFVPFTRISACRADGHGLGLSIVRRIVEKLGGQVGVESAVGAGAKFWFELPTIAR